MPRVLAGETAQRDLARSGLDFRLMALVERWVNNAILTWAVMDASSSFSSNESAAVDVAMDEGGERHLPSDPGISVRGGEFGLGRQSIVHPGSPQADSPGCPEPIPVGLWGYLPGQRNDAIPGLDLDRIDLEIHRERGPTGTPGDAGFPPGAMFLADAALGFVAQAVLRMSAVTVGNPAKVAAGTM
jgi:hypothetical protein